MFHSISAFFAKIGLALSAAVLAFSGSPVQGPVQAPVVLVATSTASIATSTPIVATSTATTTKVITVIKVEKKVETGITPTANVVVPSEDFAPSAVSFLKRNIEVFNNGISITNDIIADANLRHNAAEKTYYYGVGRGGDDLLNQIFLTISKNYSGYASIFKNIQLMDKEAIANLEADIQLYNYTKMSRQEFIEYLTSKQKEVDKFHSDTNLVKNLSNYQSYTNDIENKMAQLEGMADSHIPSNTALTAPIPQVIMPHTTTCNLLGNTITCN